MLGYIGLLFSAEQSCKAAQRIRSAPQVAEWGDDSTDRMPRDRKAHQTADSWITAHQMRNGTPIRPVTQAAFGGSEQFPRLLQRPSVGSKKGFKRRLPLQIPQMNIGQNS